MNKTAICQLIAWFLAVLMMGTHSVLFALAFDRQVGAAGN
jgi:hypothetical protein